MPDRDYVLQLQQWEIPQPELGRVTPGTYHPSRFQRNPNFFTINGRAFPLTVPLYTGMGERVRLRFVQRSNNSHTMHLHGHDFKVVSIDAFAQPESFRDTINIAPGTRWDVELSANNPGAWPLVGTKPFHTSNNGETPGGMMTRLIYQRRTLNKKYKLA